MSCKMTRSDDDIGEDDYDDGCGDWGDEDDDDCDNGGGCDDDGDEDSTLILWGKWWGW